jgi:large subunit ribosomal protein L24e
MAKCSFCTQEITPGTGKIFIFKDGKILNFCSNKCEKFMIKQKKNPAKLKWCNPEKKR